MATFLLVSGVILLSAGVVLAFRRTSAAAVLAYAGLVAVWYSGYAAAIMQSSLLFWAIAVIIVCGIRMAGGGASSDSAPVARYYITGGALAGMLAGLTLGQSGMISGSVTGCIIGALAWSRTPAGRGYSRGLWGLTVASGLPAVVTMTLVGMAVSQLLTNIN